MGFQFQLTKNKTPLYALRPPTNSTKWVPWQALAIWTKYLTSLSILFDKRALAWGTWGIEYQYNNELKPDIFIQECFVYLYGWIKLFMVKVLPRLRIHQDKMLHYICSFISISYHHTVILPFQFKHRLYHSYFSIDFFSSKTVWIIISYVAIILILYSTFDSNT